MSVTIRIGELHVTTGGEDPDHLDTVAYVSVRREFVPGDHLNEWRFSYGGFKRFMSISGLDQVYNADFMGCSEHRGHKLIRHEDLLLFSDAVRTRCQAAGREYIDINPMSPPKRAEEDWVLETLCEMRWWIAHALREYRLPGLSNE